MADETQHDASAGSRAGHDNENQAQQLQPNTTSTAAVPSSNPFLTSTTTIEPGSHTQPPLDTPQQPLPNPFSPSPQSQQPEEPLPELPPRPDQSYPQGQSFEEMTATATAAPVPPHDIPGAVTPPAMPTPEHAPNQEQEEADAPEVATLKAMFPDFDSAVLLSVLQSVNHDQDKAIDVLLGMSDPSYVSTQQATPPTADATDPASALLLDEQLARQLALEDEQEAQRHHRSRRDQGDQQRASGQSWPRRGAGAQAPQGPEKADFQQEITETVSKIAESGKRTFSSIVSKVKAKISEMEQNRNTQNQASGSSQQPNPYAYDQYNQGQSGPVDRHAASQAFAHEYYGAPANAAPAPAANPTAGGWTSPAQEVRGYDVDEPQRTNAQPVSIPQPNPVAPPVSGGIVGSPGNDVPRPPPTSTGSPINAAKLGILPKRPVSLLGQPNSAQGPGSPNASSPRRDPDDDDLEYMENPFEESRK